MIETNWAVLSTRFYVYFFFCCCCDSPDNFEQPGDEAPRGLGAAEEDQGAQGTASLLGSQGEGTAHQDHRQAWKDRGSVEEEINVRV